LTRLAWIPASHRTLREGSTKQVRNEVIEHDGVDFVAEAVILPAKADVVMPDTSPAARATSDATAPARAPPQQFVPFPARDHRQRRCTDVIS
jgi:hypothetical protein